MAKRHLILTDIDSLDACRKADATVHPSWMVSGRILTTTEQMLPLLVTVECIKKRSGQYLVADQKIKVTKELISVPRA